jgi:allophanate hydrolase
MIVGMKPTDVAEAALAADRAHDDAAIWITRLPDAAVLARARALEAEGPLDRPLWGVPFAVKDNIDVAGLPTTAACPGYARVADITAPAVQRMLDAGAVLIGKTNLDQFATGLVGTRSPYGIPRNVFDAALVPGGSSSGSAVAVAAGIVPIALGTDTAGSGRVPAAFGNIVGLKPTIGSVSARGTVPACRSLDTISVFARTVDAALDVQRVIAGYDAADPYSRRAPFPHLRRGAAPAGARIAVGDVAGLCDAGTAALTAGAAGALGAVQGWGTDKIDVTPFLAIARLLYDGPWVAERSAALREVIEARPDILHPVTRAILEAGLNRRAIDAFDAFHQLAQARRAAEIVFETYDALLLPTAPFCPTLAAVAADPIEINSRLGAFTNFVNLCDLVGFAVPAGLDANGRPVGVTLLGPAWSEGRLAAIADALHRIVTASMLPPPAEHDRLAADETALFCIGAHMSGLSLNSQITSLGGRFLHAARTTPAYRLYALGNRPGMVRAAPGVSTGGASAEGAAIEGEVWALPTAATGKLLGQVPPPLGFGSVMLADGPCLGFLAEAAGVADAEDITRFGGWRGWLAAKGAA